MIIAIDGMGGDHAPQEIIKGCMLALEAYQDISLVIVGQQEAIEKELTKYKTYHNRISIQNASDIITTREAPVSGIRNKKDSSMVVGLEMVKEKKSQAFISAGSTGALMAGSLLKVGRIKGIDRPALAPIIPTKKQGVLLLDVGANSECRTLNLVQFAMMGSIYMEKAFERSNPKVALVNIGEEEEKGTELVKSAYKALKTAPCNFVGNVEARDLFEGNVDVLVCDGFTGNIILKLTEGLADTIFTMLKLEFMRNILTKLAALILKPGLRNFRKKMDYTEYGGAPFLGIDGCIIKAHGSSNAIAIKNAIRQARNFIKGNVNDLICTEIKKLEEIKQ